MLDLQKGLSIIGDVVVNKRYHKDYKHVNKQRELYYKLITGDTIETLLNKFVRRETDVMFNQRVALTQAITPAVCSSIISTYNKVNRVNPSINKIEWDQDYADKKEREMDIRLAASKFYAGESLENYMEVRVKDNSFIDPNSFIVTEFLPFDETQKKADPYPFEVTCKDAIDYKYENGILQYLIVRNEIEYMIGSEKRKGFKYTIYLGKFTILLEQVAPGESGVFVEKAPTETSDFFRSDADRLFKVSILQMNALQVPAIRIGYIPDLRTDGRTMVNPFHCTLPYFMKMIKSVSEQDLTHALHVFPRLLEYRQGCRVQDATGICSFSGENRSECSKCGGTGYRPQISAQDSVIVTLPSNTDEWANLLHIDKLSQYSYVPTELVKLMDEYVVSLKHDVYRTLFNAEITTKAEVATTAFEKNIEMQNVYDTLYPYAKQMSRIYRHIMKNIATFRDFGEGFIMLHGYNKDFKFKSLEVLLAELDSAKTAGVPPSLRQEINNDIAAQIFIDDTFKLKKYLDKEKLNPFTGKTESEISTLLNSTELVSKRDRVLYANFDSVFEELEAEFNKSGKWFFDLSYEAQREAVNQKVKELIDQIQAENTTAISFPAEPIGE